MNIIPTARLSRLAPTIFLALGSLTTAYPSLVYDSSVIVSGAGFGNINRHLTIHGGGNDTVDFRLRRLSRSSTNVRRLHSGCIRDGRQRRDKRWR